MNKLKHISAVAFACSLIGSAYGQGNDGSAGQSCSTPILKLVGSENGVRNLAFSDQGDAAGKGTLPVVASACKVWPYKKSLTIVSLAYDNGTEYEKQLIVSLVDPAKNSVLASYKGVIQEDAIMTVSDGSLRVDTAPYDLAPGVRAFGLDMLTSHSQGCVDGGLGPVRMLFVRDGKALRPILDGFYLSTWTFLKGGPSCAADYRDAVIETTSYKIAIANSVTNGFADLRITATAMLEDGARSSKRPLTYMLKYDGSAYPLGTFNGAVDKIDRWHQ